MTDQYRAPETDAGKVNAHAGIGRPQAGHTLVATYIWSIVACFREARRQNEAHGFVS